MNDEEHDVDYLWGLAQKQGITIATGADGNKVLIASEAKLRELADIAKKKGFVIILLQSSEVPSQVLN